jgi:hypothetical protein
MSQEKKKKVINGGLRVNILPDKFMHSITQQQRTDQYDKNGQLIQKINY